MAFLYITEYTGLAPTVQGTDIIAAYFPPLAEQKIAIAAGNTVSAAFNKLTRWIEVTADAVCSIKVSRSNSADPVATVANYRLAIGVPKFIRVDAASENAPNGEAGVGAKIANITNT